MTLKGVKVDQVSHRLFHYFQCFFWNKTFVWKQAKAFKYTFCILHFIVETILGLKMTDYEKKNVTRGGGGQKSAQKVSRIIWNGPWRELMFSYEQLKGIKNHF